MSTPSPVKPASIRWFILLMAIAVAFIAAFWVLLGLRYSPENYEAAPMVRDITELAWFGGALVAAISGMVMLLRRPAVWRSLTVGAIPVAAISVLILLKTQFGAPIRMYDMLLFSVACGWTAILWTRGPFKTDGRNTKILRMIIWTLVAALAAYQFWLQIHSWNDLALGYADCGENARLIFNSISNPRELFLRVNPDKPLFYDHINVGIIPFLPLWFVWPDFKLAILLQILSVFGVTVPLYFIGKRAFRDESAALLLVLLWVLSPVTSQFIYSASYGFRWGNLCLLLYFVALALWTHERRCWALVIAIWAMLIKEEAAIVVGMFGVYLALFERRKILGAGLAAFAFGYFLLATSVIIPAVSGGGYGMTRFFYDLGHTKWEILLSPLVKPAVFWGHLFESTSFYFAAALLAPLLFVPLCKPSILFIGLLTFVFCCMNPILKDICFHYDAALLPVVFWGFVVVLQNSDHRHSVFAGVLVSSTVISLFLGAQPWSKPTLTIHQSPGRLALLQQVGKKVDPGHSLFATQRAAAHFVTQRYLYLDPPIPQKIDDVLLDLHDSWRGATDSIDWLQRLRGIQREAEANPQLHLATAEDGIVLYSRHGIPIAARTLVEHDELPGKARQVNFALGAGVRIVGFTLSPLTRAGLETFDRVRVTSLSTIAMPTNVDLAVRCSLQIGDKNRGDSYTSEFQPLGQSVWPVARWETNKYYADDFIILMPAGVTHEISGVSFVVLPIAVTALPLP